MQSLYAIESTSGTGAPSVPSRRLLEEKLDRSLDSFFVSVAFIAGVAGYAKVDARQRAAKLLASEEDLHVSTKIAENLFLKAVLSNKDFAGRMKTPVVERLVQDDWVRKLYLQVVKDPVYKSYAGTEAHYPPQDRDILRHIWEQYLCKEENLIAYFSDELPGWEEDIDLARMAMEQLFRSDGRLQYNQLISAEKKTYAYSLLETVIEKKDYCMELIRPKLVNWDMERVALIDLLLLRMGVCELLYFPTIPTKVTINEYIEVAKRYSTPQSGQFVNGVLDNLLKELEQENKIRKEERRSKP